MSAQVPECSSAQVPFECSSPLQVPSKCPRVPSNCPSSARVPQVPKCFECPSVLQVPKFLKCLKCPSSQVPLVPYCARALQVPWVLWVSKWPCAQLLFKWLKCWGAMSASAVWVPECLEHLESLNKSVNQPISQLIYNAGSVS